MVNEAYLMIHAFNYCCTTLILPLGCGRMANTPRNAGKNEKGKKIKKLRNKNDGGLLRFETPTQFLTNSSFIRNLYGKKAYILCIFMLKNQKMLDNAQKVLKVLFSFFFRRKVLKSAKALIVNPNTESRKFAWLQTKYCCISNQCTAS